MNIRSFIGKSASHATKALLLLAGLPFVPGIAMGTLWVFEPGKTNGTVDDASFWAALIAFIVMVGLYAWFAVTVVRAEFYSDWINFVPPPKRKPAPLSTRQARGRQKTILIVLGAILVATLSLLVTAGWRLAYHTGPHAGFAQYAGLLTALALGILYACLYVPAVRSGKLALSPRQHRRREEVWEKAVAAVAPSSPQASPKGASGRKYKPVSSPANSFYDEDCTEWYQ